MLQPPLNDLFTLPGALLEFKPELFKAPKPTCVVNVILYFASCTGVYVCVVCMFACLVSDGVFINTSDINCQLA